MKAKIFTLLITVLAFTALSTANAQNLLTDGSFDTTTVIVPAEDPAPPDIWCSFVAPWGVNALVFVEGGIAVCNIPEGGWAGSSYSEIQLMQAGFELLKEHQYRLSFDVRADAERTYGLFLGEVGGNWNSLIGYDKYYQYATTDWQTVVIDFKTPLIFDYNKLSFETGMVNINTYFDNVSVTDLGAYTPSVGILGSSLSGWDTDVDMQTTDGVNYTLRQHLATGRVKFRQDDTWMINWGGTEFPTGTGSSYGPDIMVSNPGTYEIAFNRETAEYSFSCVENCSPFVGIAGTAVPPYNDWNTDVDMKTFDGITYVLTGYQFTDGEAKFRRDNSWTENWSNNLFPSGNAIADGPAIPVTAGNYTVTFNIVTGEYRFDFPGIGILGDALPGWWYEDIDMTTADGITYTLTDYPFSQGEVKFRQENVWDVNWGNYIFPTGYGYQDGPNIPVPEGTYTVTFNRLTGEYTFVSTSCPVPAIQCPDFVYVPSEPGLCGAYVYYPAVVPAASCGGDGIVITQTEGLPSGAFFPVGYTANTFMLTNADGNTTYCGLGVYVYDSEAPVITGLKENYDPLWPPDHRMVEVPLDYTVYDNCGSTTCEIYIYSNEVENGPGDGDSAPDWEIIDDHNILLRAERSGSGNGREYYISIQCRDESWNYTYQDIIIKVPHDMGEKSPLMISVWPNPSDYSFTLQVGSETDLPIRITVSDAAGRQLSKYQIRNNETISFGSNLLPGIYLVKVSQGNYSETVTIMKQ